LRLVSRRAEIVDQAFWRKALQSAIEFRRRVVTDSDSYRLVHAEADFLPGLIVDRYADYLAVQLLTQGMDRHGNDIVGALNEMLQPKGILARNDAAVRVKEQLPQEIRVLQGEVPMQVDIRMNGLALQADLQAGQKTGVFLDQRENYVAIRRWARGRALDCFTGSGGFALHLASACEHVEAVDSSAPAINAAHSNAGRNGLTNIEFRVANVLDYLPGLVAARRQFEIVIVDPPAFAKTRSAIEDAARGYKEINLRALRLLGKGGVLVSCSCSHHMSEARLLEIVAQAALDAGKQLRVLERRTQAPDHPILLTVPETHYLKCLIFEVV
jgi:23S rRNA (cytosine1962-C5)-methyltransferase